MIVCFHIIIYYVIYMQNVEPSNQFILVKIIIKSICNINVVIIAIILYYYIITI